jgi:hypothetical protein
MNHLYLQISFPFRGHLSTSLAVFGCCTDNTDNHAAPPLRHELLAKICNIMKSALDLHFIMHGLPYNRHEVRNRTRSASARARVCRFL